jgi:hypothetical protein
MSTLIQSDFHKMRKSWIFNLSVIGALCMLLAQVVNYSLRYDFLYKSGWQGNFGLLAWVSLLYVLSLMLGATVITSMSASMEQDAKSEKQLYALPISRMQAFLSKGIVLTGFLLIAAVLTYIFILSFGLAIQLPGPVPWIPLAKLIFYPIIMVIPFLTFQLFLATYFRSQVIAIIAGVIGAFYGKVMSMPMKQVNHWLLWSFPHRMGYLDATLTSWLPSMVALTLIIGIIGGYLYANKEIVS